MIQSFLYLKTQGGGLDHQGAGWAVPRTETAGLLGSFGALMFPPLLSSPAFGTQHGGYAVCGVMIKLGEDFEDTIQQGL